MDLGVPASRWPTKAEDLKTYIETLKFVKNIKGVTIECLSFEQLISNYDKVDVLFYYDLPYVGTENYYKNTQSFGIKEHE